MLRDSFLIAFPGVSTADANQYASDLAVTLRDLHNSIVAEQRRDRENTQDFGATLAVILGTASITAVANGIAAWLMRHSGAKIQISTKGNVIATNLDSGDAAKIAEAFSRRR
jgi:hypothetical protein